MTSLHKRFARETASGTVEPSADHVWLEDGFESGRIYQLVYKTDRAPVAGLGLRAVDRLVHDEVAAGRQRETLEHEVEGAGAGDVAHDAGDRDRARVDHRVERARSVCGSKMMALNASPLGSTPTRRNTSSRPTSSSARQ